MLKISSVPVSVGLCIASLSLASGAIVTAPYLIANRPVPDSQASQCRTLFSTVVNSKNVNQSFYRRKALQIGALSLADNRLRSLQARFSHVFYALDKAQRSSDRTQANQLGKQASQLVHQLSQQCFQ